MTSTAAAGGDDCCDDCCEDSPLCLQACGCIIALPSMMLGITAAALAGSEHEAASVIVPIGWVALGIELVSLAFLWGWYGVALLLLIGFVCMLRVSEIFRLCFTCLEMGFATILHRTNI